jgi:hypothetical protein
LHTKYFTWGINLQGEMKSQKYILHFSENLSAYSH